MWCLTPGVSWNALPTAAFGASGARCWWRLKEWHEAGVWRQLHELILAELRAAGRLDLSAAIIDSSHLRALKGGSTPAGTATTSPNCCPSAARAAARGITPYIARRHHWHVERTIAWLHAFKKLRGRTERRADIHQALISLARSVICLRQLILN
jgi:transposase